MQRLTKFLAATVVIGLAGCALNDPSPATASRSPEFGEKVAMSVPSGAYQNYIVESMNGGNPIAVNITLSQPRSTTQWAPSVRLCARGNRLPELSCLWLFVDPDGKTIRALSQSGSDVTRSTKSFLPYQSRVGDSMAITIKLQPSSYNVSIDGNALPAIETDFEIKGYSFGCVSATCSFDFPA